jgi:hypothetical protein
MQRFSPKGVAQGHHLQVVVIDRIISYGTVFDFNFFLTLSLAIRITQIL